MYEVRNIDVGVSQTKALVRSGSTQRFHTEAGDLIKTQDVAQHSYGVFWFVLALTKFTASRDLLIAAMAHDAGERWVGDVPAPTKRTLTMRPELHVYEAQMLRRVTGFAPPELGEHENWILKAADYLDGGFFCQREIKLGNEFIAPVLNNFISYLRQLPLLPAMENFDADLFWALIKNLEDLR